MAQTDAEKKLLRILHYGCEEAIYVPGCRLQKKFYEEDKVNQLRSIIAEIEHEKLFDIIRKVMREKTSLYPDLILYVLAECARSEIKRPDALKAAEEMCTTAEYFLLFFKFAKAVSPYIGTGRACRRFITNWYLKKNSLELAEMVGETPSYRGWRHADLIKIAHIKSTDPATAAVLTYLSRGAKTMIDMYGEDPKAKEVVSYLKNVDNFRKDGDEGSVIRTIETYMLTVSHLNFIHLKKKQVWIALLRRMPVDTLLDYIHLLCKYRMFRKGRMWDQEFLTAVCDVLCNVNSIAETRLQPSRVFIDLCTYQFAPKYKLELAAKSLRRLAQKPPAISYELVTNLEKLIIATYDNVEPTGLRYVIAVDNSDMHKRRCAHLQYMMTSQAAAAIAVTFYVAEKQCDILLCQGSTTTPLNFKTKKPKIADVAEKFVTGERFQRSGPKYVLASLVWAVKQKKEVDVFIIIGTCLQFQGLVGKVAELRSKLLVPNFRLVLCCLCDTHHQPIKDNNILTVIGFDEKVCQVIARFAKGIF
ncbi:RNA-binding protein RO60-like [Rhodnius prolixus]